MQKLLPKTEALVSPTPTAPDFIVLGKLIDASGIKGALKIFPFADDPLAWSKLKNWWLGQETQAPASWQKVAVQSCRLHGKVLIATLDCSPDRNAAEALCGALIGVPREALPKTAANEFYWADLIGLTVVNAQNEFLGHVHDLIETPANAVLQVVREEQGKRCEILIPFVKAHILDTNMQTRRIVADWQKDWN